jgi:uncharacterized protein
MRLAVLPRSGEFYELFERAGKNALAAARLTERRFRDFPDTDIPQEHVKDLEHEGDFITRSLIHLLNTQYVTPFDREDIYELARAVDDVVDDIEHASDLLTLYRVEGPMQQAQAQAAALVEAAGSLAQALASLRSPGAAIDHIAAVKEWEDDADQIVRDAIASLFEDEDVDPRVIIRWKDIFEALETAVDACETASHVVGNIVVKNS